MALVVFNHSAQLDEILHHADQTADSKNAVMDYGDVLDELGDFGGVGRLAEESGLFGLIEIENHDKSSDFQLLFNRKDSLH
jgi:hypothetical protein